MQTIKHYEWMTAGLFMLVMAAISPTVQANVCDKDIETYCGYIRAGDGVGQCIESKGDQISYPCRQLIKKLERSLKELKSACDFDVVNYCRDVKPGYGRLKECLINNTDKLSPNCQLKIKQFQSQGQQ